jgi:beta-glucosidase
VREPSAQDTGDLEALLRKRLSALDLVRKVRLLTGKDGWALHEMPEIGLQSVVTSDGPGGVRGTLWDERDPSLNVPNATSLAATWDDDLVETAGQLIGADARSKGVHVLLAPTIGLHRSPLGGRNFEAWSEDPYLTGRLASAFVRGVQSQGVGATAKHFVLNDSETERRSYDAQVAEDVLHELYLRPFEDLVREGVWLVMAAYNRHAGMLMTEHRPLTWDVLKQRWGFDGVVVSDWHAVRSTVASARSGTDLEMPAAVDQHWGDALVDAVRNGEVDEATIDDKVLRVLRLAARTGALEGAGIVLPEPATLADADRELRGIAGHGMVLLRNTGVLPLDPTIGSLALIGELADHVSTQGGGAAHVEPVHVVQPLDALRSRFGDRLVHEPGPAVSRMLWPLPLDLTRDPVEGGPGFHLEIFDASGNMLRTEHREAATFVFHGTLPAGTASLRWTTDLRVSSGGVHQLAVIGRGRFRVLVDDAEIGTYALTPDLDDDVQAIVHPPEARIDVELDPDIAVRLVVETEPLLAAGGTLWRFGIGYRAPQPDDDEMLRRAVDAASTADAAVVIVGATDDHEVEGLDRIDLRLPGRQDELVSAIAAANPDTVVVVNAGSVYAMPWADEVAAIVWAGMPGQEAGDALTDVLTGVLEPWGRLTSTVPPADGDAPIPSTTPVDGVLAYDEGHAVGYRGYQTTGATPQFAFGHGLGYTTWSFEAAELSADGSALTISVRNTGARAGREVVQVYYQPDAATIRLVGFAGVVAEPGQRCTLTVHIDACAASRWDVQASAWTPLVGGELRIGRSVADLLLTVPVDRRLGL